MEDMLRMLLKVPKCIEGGLRGLKSHNKITYSQTLSVGARLAGGFDRGYKTQHIFASGNGEWLKRLVDEINGITVSTIWPEEKLK